MSTTTTPPRELAARTGMPVPLWLRMLDCVDDVAANLALLVIAIASVWAVLARYVTRGASEWTIELIAAAFAWLVFMGAAAVHKRRALIGVDSLVALLPSSLRFWTDRIAILVTMVFAGVAAWLGLTLSLDSLAVPMGVSSIPLAVPYLGLTCGTAIICIRSAIRLVSRTREERP